MKKVHAFYSCGPFIVSGVIGAETAEGKKKKKVGHAKNQEVCVCPFVFPGGPLSVIKSSCFGTQNPEIKMTIKTYHRLFAFVR